MPEWVGRTVGKVRIDKFLAHGGMAEVYLGTHLTLDRQVAIKVLHTHIEQDPDLRLRFEREAKASAGLRHPNVVQVYDYDTVEGHPYLVMEYLRGPTLGTYLRSLHESGRRLPLEEILHLIGGAADGLDYAHGLGLIHRDVKPGNIMLHGKLDDVPLSSPFTRDIEPVITDFGLVRMGQASSVTMSGTVTGTPHYMSPEQAAGAKVDHRTDIYSLGVVLYEMLAGRLPFEGDTTLTVMYKQMHVMPPPIPGLSPLAEAVIERALAKDPSNRYQSCGEMLSEFAAAVSGTGRDKTHAPSPNATVLEKIIPEEETPVRPETPFVPGATQIEESPVQLIKPVLPGKTRVPDESTVAKQRPAASQGTSIESAPPDFPEAVASEGTAIEAAPPAFPMPAASEATSIESAPPDFPGPPSTQASIPPSIVTPAVAIPATGPAKARGFPCLVAVGIGVLALVVIAGGALLVLPKIRSAGAGINPPDATAGTAAPAGNTGLPVSDGMVKIPGGSYHVGAAPANDFHAAPQDVTLGEFWLDQYQVTNAQYQSYVSTGGAQPQVWPGEANHPVRGVTWDQASAYCASVGKRLASEAEWEAAGRGPGQDPPLYPWGTDPAADGNVLQMPDQDTYEIGSQAFNKSPLGISDLVGNVWEWVGEAYSDITPGYKLLRGGRFGLSQDLAYRLAVAPDDNRYVKFAGFRCAASQVR